MTDDLFRIRNACGNADRAHQNKVQGRAVIAQHSHLMVKDGEREKKMLASLRLYPLYSLPEENTKCHS